VGGMPDLMIKIRAIRLPSNFYSDINTARICLSFIAVLVFYRLKTAHPEMGQMPQGYQNLQ
jgi:hypothetical protein